ncbi:hypothetical protein EYF80_059564 [Liparis tanakae]|uniref:Uncharacterized protein n=1 Tax=Liparis tanakae TaxID=230148 RepID=A0A4Z2ENA0_9TELE|nr:hypothetical protein EYF80_059564 [Liparis tanakae]
MQSEPRRSACTALIGCGLRGARRHRTREITAGGREEPEELLGYSRRSIQSPEDRRRRMIWSQEPQILGLVLVLQR